MSATTTLRRTEITDRALDSKYFRRDLENRALENRALANRFMQNRYMESKLYQADNRYFRVSSRFFELADRLWLADVEDAAALLEIEDRVAKGRYLGTI